MDAYSEKTNDKGETRVILKLHHSMAPIKVAVLPLAKNKPEIVGMAKAIKRSLQPLLRAVYDDTGGIGKLYARQDEIGTPFCVTVDHQSLEDEAVTVRDRDTWEQERVKVADLASPLAATSRCSHAESALVISFNPEQLRTSIMQPAVKSSSKKDNAITFSDSSPPPGSWTEAYDSYIAPNLSASQCVFRGRCRIASKAGMAEAHKQVSNTTLEVQRVLRRMATW